MNVFDDEEYGQFGAILFNDKLNGICSVALSSTESMLRNNKNTVKSTTSFTTNGTATKYKVIQTVRVNTNLYLPSRLTFHPDSANKGLISSIGISLIHSPPSLTVTVLTERGSAHVSACSDDTADADGNGELEKEELELAITSPRVSTLVALDEMTPLMREVSINVR